MKKVDNFLEGKLSLYNPIPRVLALEIRPCDDFNKVLKNFCIKNLISLKNVMFVRNDLDDFGLISSVGFPVAPIDANLEIKRIARYVIEVKVVLVIWVICITLL